MKLLLIPENKDDSHEDVTVVLLDASGSDELTNFGDSVPTKVKDIGDFTFKVKYEDEDGEDVELTDLRTVNKLRLGASYEYLLQYNEDDDSENQNIMVSYV